MLGRLLIYLSIIYLPINLGAKQKLLNAAATLANLDAEIAQSRWTAVLQALGVYMYVHCMHAHPPALLCWRLIPWRLLGCIYLYHGPADCGRTYYSSSYQGHAQ